MLAEDLQPDGHLDGAAEDLELEHGAALAAIDALDLGLAAHERAVHDAHHAAFHHGVRHIHHAVAASGKGVDPGDLLIVERQELAVHVEEPREVGQPIERRPQPAGLGGVHDQVPREQGLLRRLPLVAHAVGDAAARHEALVQQARIDPLLDEAAGCGLAPGAHVHHVPHG